MKRFLTLIIFSLLTLTTYAQVPQTLSFQGVLINTADGKAINGSYDFTFSLFDVDTLGISIWSETQTAVTVTDGIYNVTLGKNVAIALNFDKPYYLEVTVGTETLTPRIALTSSGYDLNNNLQDLVDGSLSGGKVGAGINAANITVGTITSAQLANGAVNGGTGGVIADGTITAADLAPNSVAASEIATGAVVGGTGGDIADGTITAADLAPNSVAASEIATGAVVGGTGGDIADGTITAADLAPNSVAADEIAAGAVGTSEIATNGVAAAEIAAGAVGASEIATGAVVGGTGGDIADGTITNADISTTAAIADTKLATITTTNKVSGGAVGTGINGSNITTGTIADSRIENDRWASTYRLEGGTYPLGAYFIIADDWQLDIVNNQLQWIRYTNGSSTATVEYVFSGAQFSPGSDGGSSLGTSSVSWSNVYTTNGNVQTSDRRLKQNITSLSYGLSSINSLRPVSFEWKKSPGKTKLGLIAQELLEIIPEVVNIGDDEQQTLGVYYADLIPVLIKAIQEQQEIIDGLKHQQAIQKDANASLESRLAKLEEMLSAQAINK